MVTIDHQEVTKEQNNARKLPSSNINNTNGKSVANKPPTIPSRKETANGSIILSTKQPFSKTQKKPNGEPKQMPDVKTKNELTKNNNNDNSKAQTQRENLASRDSLISNISDLIELDPALLRSNPLTPIIDDLNLDIKNVKTKEIVKEDKKDNKKDNKNEDFNRNKKSPLNNTNTKDGNKSKNSTITTVTTVTTKSKRSTGSRFYKVGVDSIDNRHSSYADKYYSQNSYMASWREKYREQIKEFGPEYVNLNVPVENENQKKSKGRPKYRDTFEDMPFYNPVAVSLMKPYYGNFPLENSKDFYTNDKLYQKLKDDKKEFVDQQKDPAIREMLYKISDKHQKSYMDKLTEENWKAINGGLSTNSRYSIEDYRKLKKNYGFGKEFGKIRNIDFETREEKLEKVQKRSDVGNKFMKANKNNNSSDEREGSKTPPINQTSSLNTFRKVQSGDKIEDGYYNGFIKQLNDKKHIKVHHPFLKKNSVKYDSKPKTNKIKSSITDVSLIMENSTLPSLVGDKFKNTSDAGMNTPMDEESLNLPTLVKHFTTQLNNKNEIQTDSNTTSRDFLEGVPRNDNVSLLKLQFSDRVPNSRQTSKSRAQNLNLITARSNDKIFNNNNNNHQTNETDNKDNGLTNAETKSTFLDHSESYINLNDINATGKITFITDNEGVLNMNNIHEDSKSFHKIDGFDSPDDVKIGTRQTARNTPGSMALQSNYTRSDESMEILNIIKKSNSEYNDKYESNLSASVRKMALQYSKQDKKK